MSGITMGAILVGVFIMGTAWGYFSCLSNRNNVSKTTTRYIRSCDDCGHCNESEEDRKLRIKKKNERRELVSWLIDGFVNGTNGE